MTFVECFKTVLKESYHQYFENDAKSKHITSIKRTDLIVKFLARIT